ncbi:hypothetical protein VOLCADRAFT_100201 [Volvox carteri f. nagariensis]|uniref:Uncharacterized protein n=1 Tax=Volvox carteri f. nagariensis TaxID=3068 RepID=D8UJP1_VOLCA|nr:uncharacterized protein VOLCADRAFT_100201 [Volvox carteri f. nagariensis]EFJ40056.1 hypothetical protein VOLCADRAFT_100201 [Volvox carteri f. nagariensis]|eukprot:XP_002958868.1 hypothetical protein VOLCADRAFT_100201 [Volvox carteri f. nagariensis]
MSSLQNELLLDVEDSIVVGLYHYLWLKDGKGRACPEVNIPHTVIISNGRPKTWYFTSGKEHCIKRKNRANITNANITDALAPRPKLSSTSTLNTNRANTRNNNFASNRATTVAYGGGNNSSSGGGTADPSAALLGAWGAPSNPPTTQQQQLQLQQQQSQAGHRRNKSADAAAAAAAFADGGRAPDGTCTGTTLGPWPHHGVVARFQGSMTNPHNAGVTSNRGASLGRKKKGTAAAAAAAADGGGDASGGGRFLCVLTGEMYPAATERYDVTYKQLLQHWFSLASQLPNEGDRLRAMDTIPLAIRRANPSLTREWYLRVRSQPTFLYRTAPVCVEAAAQITGMALEDLQRALQPTPSGMMGVMAAAAAAVGGSGATGGTAWPPAGSPGAAAAAGGGGGGGGGGGISNSGMGILAGWAAAGAAVQTHGSPPVTARGPVAEGLSRQATANTSLRVQLAASGSVRRPSTALPPAGPSSHSLLQQPQTTPFRSGSRQQLPSAAHQHSPNSQPGAGPSRRFMPRSKSASPSVASSRLSAVAHNNGGGGGGGGGGGLPSMLVPRAENEKSAGSGLGRVPSFLQVYGPTPEQAAEAAAIAAALPYEVLDEARQLAGAEDAAAAAAAETEGVETEGEEATSPRGGHRRLQGDAAADADGGGGGGGCDLSDGSATAADGSRTTSQGDAAGCTLAAPAGSPNEPRNAVNATTAAATTSGGGSRAAAAGLGGSPGLGYATAAVTAANGGGGGSGYSPPRPGRLPGRMSASSEITEMGSIASFSDPSSPSVNHASYNHLHGHGHGHAYSHTYLHPPPPLASSGGGGGGGGGSAAAVGSPGSIGASRMSPPRSAGAPTLHTIHEEGAAAVLPPPPSASSRRSGSPLVGGTELLFPPPSRGGSGSHSVPRMRPPARPGMDRQLAAGSSGGAGRRHPGPPPTYGHSGGGAAATAGGGLQRGNSLSESGDLPVLPGTAAAAAAAASLNSTMASSIGSLSRRSTSNQAVLSTEDIRTLRELSEAYTAAERLTQQLLAQAHEILSEDGGSRPGSTGTSPMHGARQGRTAPSPRALTPTSRPGTGNSGFSGTRQPSVSSTGTGTGTGGGGGGSRLMRLSSGSGRPGTTGTQRPSSSSLPTAQPPPASATGPTTAGVEPYVNRTGSGRSVGSGSGGAGDAATPPATALAAASLVSAPGQAISPGADLIMGLGRSSPGTGDGGDGGVVAAAAAAAARHSPGDLDLFTSAEADLLAEALQE